MADPAPPRSTLRSAPEALPRTAAGPSHWTGDVGLGLAALLLYSLTLMPGVLPADAGEFQVVGALLGVAHPPGFALYTLLSWLISRLPGIPPATSINWLSAVFAALTLVLLSRVVRQVSGSRWAGVCAALALGFSTTFWAQATTANIRMPTACALALALDRVAAYQRRRDGRALALVALALGLGVSHHGSLVFIAVILGVYTLWLDPRVLRRPRPLAWGALPFLAWLYFPLRAGAFGAPERIATPSGFLEHILARGFAGDIFHFATPGALPDRLRILGNILTFEFTWPILLLAALGVAAGLRRERRWSLVLLAALAAHTFTAITYRAPQTVEYLLPSYVLIGVFIGFALAELLRLTNHLAGIHSQPLIVAGARAASYLSVLFVLGAQLIATFPSYLALARDASVRDRVEALLRHAPPRAAILASWHWATPLWYQQQVAGQRPDVEVLYVFPQGASLGQTWAERIAGALPGRPVIVTSFFPQAYAHLPYRFLPLGAAWEVRAEPLTTPPDGLAGRQSFEAWDFLGYQLETPGAQPADQGIALTAAWRTNAAPHDINFFVHLLGGNGALVGQMDLGHGAGSYVSGEVLLDRYVIVPRPGTEPGDYTLSFGAYLPDGQRIAEARPSTVTLTEGQPLLLTPASDRSPNHIPFARSISLTRTDFSSLGPLRPGESLEVELHFLAHRPLLDDYAVKVELAGLDWRVGSEGTPAGGAIPTLKWIAGSRITDRRRLTIPAHAGPGAAQLSVVLYDSLTQQTLPVLDPTATALGPGVLLAKLEIVRP